MPWSAWTVPAGTSPRNSPSRPTSRRCFLPAYSPELNAIERVWLYLRERFRSHRLWPSYDDILDACCAAWNALLNETGRIRSLCTLDWAAPVSS
jgi:transposase